MLVNSFINVNNNEYFKKILASIMPTSIFSLTIKY